MLGYKLRKWLDLGKVPTFKMDNIGTVLTFKIQSRDPKIL